MKRLQLALVVAVVATALSGCTPASETPVFSPWPLQSPETTQTAPSHEQHVSALSKLKVRDDVFVGGYHRDAFLGEYWPEVEGCSMREIVLAHDLTTKKVAPNCHVTSGVLTDPYDGQEVQLATNTDGSSTIEIDHTVSLLDAFISGAKTWTAQRKHAFAIDPLNLKATSKETNKAKDWYAADRWQPATTAGKCLFAQTIVKVKTRYALSITKAEKKALAQDLAVCS